MTKQAANGSLKAELEKEKKARIEAEKRLADYEQSALILKAQGKVFPDGILVVNPEGKVISYNQRFVEMWGIPDEMVDTGRDELLIESVIASLVDPEGFKTRIKFLYDNPEESLLLLLSKLLDVSRLRSGEIEIHASPDYS